jgi:nucleoside-diphosphate-sugar epimerase
MFYDSLNFSSAKAHRLLGFSCRHTLEQGIENTVRWYRDRGYL